MTNSDFLLKAAIKKVTEKLNEILIEKIEEATNIAKAPTDGFLSKITVFKFERDV